METIINTHQTVASADYGGALETLLLSEHRRTLLKVEPAKKCVVATTMAAPPVAVSLTKSTLEGTIAV